MSTNAAVILQVGDKQQRYYHHWDGYVSNMFPMLDFARKQVHHRKDTPFEVIEARFWLTFNLHERSLAAGSHEPDRLEERRAEVERIQETGMIPGGIILEDGSVGAYMDRVDRNSLERVPEGEGMPNAFKIAWTYVVEIEEGYTDIVVHEGLSDARPEDEVDDEPFKLAA